MPTHRLISTDSDSPSYIIEDSIEYDDYVDIIERPFENQTGEYYFNMLTPTIQQKIIDNFMNDDMIIPDTFSQRLHYLAMNGGEFINQLFNWSITYEGSSYWIPLHNNFDDWFFYNNYRNLSKDRKEMYGIGQDDKPITKPTIDLENII